MIDVEIYKNFANNCVCLHCQKHGKIVEKEGKIQKIISCSKFRNKPKAYIGSCKEYVKSPFF
ncbi:MAG: hypothetical protein JW891_13885 [Candidatus Lokiarchaeota archaeon]|nr:hypothetical protein [Candidatus Lokiarchaeota archaeon]